MEMFTLLQAIAALALVLALIGLMGLGLRHWGGSKLASRMQEGRRLKLVEQLYLDPKRRLVLLQCDEREHLLLLAEHQMLEIGSQKPEAGEKKKHA